MIDLMVHTFVYTVWNLFWYIKQWLIIERVVQKGKESRLEKNAEYLFGK